MREWQLSEEKEKHNRYVCVCGGGKVAVWGVRRDLGGIAANWIRRTLVS